MNVIITTRGYKAKDRVKNYVNEKLHRLERFADIIMSTEVIISYEKLDQVVEFKVKLRSKVIRIKEKSEDVYKSIDLAIDNVERQIARAKDKMKDRNSVKIVENLEY
jgi:putative sigma-54 modulation protein